MLNTQQHQIAVVIAVTWAAALTHAWNKQYTRRWEGWTSDVWQWSVRWSFGEWWCYLVVDVFSEGRVHVYGEHLYPAVVWMFVIITTKDGNCQWPRGEREREGSCTEDRAQKSPINLNLTGSTDSGGVRARMRVFVSWWARWPWITGCMLGQAPVLNRAGSSCRIVA